MKKNGWQLLDDRWQKTKREAKEEWTSKEYDYVGDFLNEMMSCDEKGNCRAGRRHWQMTNGKIWDKWQIKNDNDKDTDKCKDNDSDKHKYNDNDKHSDNDNEHDKDTENTNTMTKIQI